MPAHTQTNTQIPVKPLAQKLFERFTTGPISERRPDLGQCWLWTRRVGKDGYARIHFTNGSLAHRLMFELVRGPIPFGLELDHLCRRDLLDHVIVLNERHLKRLMTEYIRYYHDDRTHLGLDKETPAGRVAGLHHRYDLAA
jgi:hypothetical protein